MKIASRVFLLKHEELQSIVACTAPNVSSFFASWVIAFLRAQT